MQDFIKVKVANCDILETGIIPQIMFPIEEISAIIFLSSWFEAIVMEFFLMGINL